MHLAIMPGTDVPMLVSPRVVLTGLWIAVIAGRSAWQADVITRVANACILQANH